MDDPTRKFFRQLYFTQQFRAAHTGPEPCDMNVIAEQVAEALAQEDRDAVYYPVESVRGRELRDVVLAMQDLLSVIFVHCLPDMGITEYMPPCPRHAPMLLAQVSQHWRRVTLSTPSLWSSFPLHDGFSKRLYRLWIRRSGATPLSFSAQKDTLKTALPFSLRWQNVTLDFEQDYEMDAVSLSAALAPVKNKIPLLRRLRLNFPCTMGFLWEKGLPVTSTCDIFENAPNLRSVTLDYPLCSFKLPFSQLVELKIYSPLGLDELLRCCREAPNLQSLSTMIDLRSTTHYPSADTTPCHFAKLTYLSIQDLTLPNPRKPSVTVPRQLGPLLDKMTCPVLDEMWLNIATKLPDIEYLPTMDSLFRFLRRSPIIKRFTIDDNFKCDDNLIGLLECCPALEEFEVAHDHRGTIGTAFFERLTYREDSSTPTMCPRLRILDLGHRHNLESDESALASAEMVASRWRIADGAPIARLEKLVVNCYERECTTRLREFEAEGLEVSLPTLELVRVPKEKEKENAGCTSH